MVGDVEANDMVNEALKNGLVLKIVEGLQDNMSRKMRFSSDKKA